MQFNKHCHLRYGKAVQNMPLEMAATAPAATVDPAVYLPPALRCAHYAPSSSAVHETLG